MAGAQRRPEHARNPELETLLRELNDELAGNGPQMPADGGQPEQPVVFIVGAPRSGTTILLQWLAASGAFGVPTNLISRFYAAPHVGALVQRLLSDPRFDFNGELAGLPTAIDFDSRLGKTRGPLAPNEFWYFWRRFVPNEMPRLLSPEEAARIDGRGLAWGLARLATALGKPLALKALIVQYNLAALAQAVPRSLFIDIEREPLFAMQSILLGREEYWGDRETWWSVEPPGVETLQRLDAYGQVAGQVALTRRSLRQQLEALDESRSLRVSYEAFCADPAATWARIGEKLRGLGGSLDAAHTGQARFHATNDVRLPPNEWKRLEGAYADFG